MTVNSARACSSDTPGASRPSSSNCENVRLSASKRPALSVEDGGRGNPDIGAERIVELGRRNPDNEQRPVTGPGEAPADKAGSPLETRRQSRSLTTATSSAPGCSSAA